MDIAQLATGGGGGLLASILALFAVHRRLERVEEAKQDKTVCEAHWKFMESLDHKIDHIIDRLDTHINGRS